MPAFPLRLLLPAAAVAALSLQSQAKPCTRPSGHSADSLLSRANLALDLPGTRRVTVDPTGTCLVIDVSSPGTARLVKLMLRGMDVPRDAVRFQVVS
jgi:hypothetical protein